MYQTGTASVFVDESEVLMSQVRGRSTLLWPFGARVAIVSSIVGFGVLLTAALVLQEHGWMGSLRMNLTLFLVIVAIAAVPLLLRLLDTVAKNGGTFEIPGGFKLSIAEARTSAQLDARQSQMAPNITGNKGMNLADSGGSEVLDALRPRPEREIVVLDLGEGDLWWRTRLLLLCAGAVRVGSPTAVVFTGTLANSPARFIGWATPTELLRLLLRDSDPKIVAAYRNATVRAARLALYEPGLANQMSLPWAPASPGVPQQATEYFRAADWHAMPEMVLAEKLNAIESPGVESDRLDLALTVSGVREAFGAVLRTDTIDATAPDDQWIQRVLCGTQPYVAVTNNGVYQHLVDRDTVINLILRNLVAPGQACGAPSPGCC